MTSFYLFPEYRRFPFLSGSPQFPFLEISITGTAGMPTSNPVTFRLSYVTFL